MSACPMKKSGFAEENITTFEADALLIGFADVALRDVR